MAIVVIGLHYAYNGFDALKWNDLRCCLTKFMAIFIMDALKDIVEYSNVLLIVECISYVLN